MSAPSLTMMIAPPGWECQPEEPPGLTVICAMATSVPNRSGMVPCDVSVPRAKGMFVSPDGGVAAGYDGHCRDHAGESDAQQYPSNGSFHASSFAFGAVATRYDKRGRIYQGTVDVASIRIWLRNPP